MCSFASKLKKNSLSWKTVKSSFLFLGNTWCLWTQRTELLTVTGPLFPQLTPRSSLHRSFALLQRAWPCVHCTRRSFINDLPAGSPSKLQRRHRQSNTYSSDGSLWGMFSMLISCYLLNSAVFLHANMAKSHILIRSFWFWENRTRKNTYPSPHTRMWEIKLYYCHSLKKPISFEMWSNHSCTH